MSSNSKIIAYGDSSGHVHLWANTQNIVVNQKNQPNKKQYIYLLHLKKIKFNNYSVPLYFPEPGPACDVSFNVDDDVSLSSMTSFPIDDGQSSGRWNRRNFPVSMPLRPLDPMLNSALKPYELGHRISLKDLSGPQLKALVSADPRLARRLSISKTGHPCDRPDKMYRAPRNKSRFSGNTIKSWNKTALPGLDNAIQGPHVNSLVQALYYIPQMRAQLLCHTCSREFCTACELSFMFRSMDQSRKHDTCYSAKNLVRTLTLLPLNNHQAQQQQQQQQSGCKSLFPEFGGNNGGGGGSGGSGSNGGRNKKTSDLTQATEDLTKFVLKNIDRELAGPPDAPSPGVPSIPLGAAQAQSERKFMDEMVRVRTKTSCKCTNCFGTWEKPGTSLVLDLEKKTYRSIMQVPPSNRLCESLEATLCKESNSKMRCEKCSHNQQVIQNKSVLHLPEVLCLNTNSFFDVTPNPINQTNSYDISQLTNNTHFWLFSSSFLSFFLPFAHCFFCLTAVVVTVV